MTVEGVVHKEEVLETVVRLQVSLTLENYYYTLTRYNPALIALCQHSQPPYHHHSIDRHQLPCSTRTVATNLITNYVSSPSPWTPTTTTLISPPHVHSLHNFLVASWDEVIDSVGHSDLSLSPLSPLSPPPGRGCVVCLVGTQGLCPQCQRTTTTSFS
eukprot:TRINITY_DN523_c0_g2_i3.p1 TRINITY_DN523_c0_g2~~TRINITY_DN523_c0_g2_i3.p1  ORF type:complete len:158 (+),score=8.30 TRINITY_DN523_c0_g2_i3:161-634(+)